MKFSMLYLIFFNLFIAQSVVTKEAESGNVKSLYDAFVDVFLHNFDKEKISTDLVHILKGRNMKKAMKSDFSIWWKRTYGDLFQSKS